MILKIKIFEDIRDLMGLMDASVIVPSYIESRMIAFVVMGKKKSGEMYSQDDLVVFSILANQSALAIENALFYENMQKNTRANFLKPRRWQLLEPWPTGFRIR